MNRNHQILGSAAQPVQTVRQSAWTMSPKRGWRSTALALSCGLTLAALAGCGQKGPLYLPAPAASSPSSQTSSS